ncbi:MAG: response regulator [Nitrospirae bacterium]|nr:response regulator [Nitrospirota bacterium]
MKTLKALIVDDVASMRKFLKYGLEKSFPHMSVEEAMNGKEAQTKLEKNEYDLVLCDWEMPLLNGEELLTWLRNHPTLRKTPFIMVTSRSDKPSVLKALQGGVDSYVVKPFTADSLAQKVMNIVDRADRRELERFDVQGSATLHFGDQVARGFLIDVSLGGIFSSFGRENKLPTIFDKVNVDIKFEKSQKVDGIEGFIIRIQAAEAFIDAESVKIAVKFLELPENRRNELDKILSSLKH